MPKALASVPDELDETLRWATERLREIYGPRLKHLILFGSQARGDAEPESDVDLLVVLEEPITSIEEAKRTSPVATQAAAPSSGRSGGTASTCWSYFPKALPLSLQSPHQVIGANELGHVRTLGHAGP